MLSAIEFLLVNLIRSQFIVSIYSKIKLCISNEIAFIYLTKNHFPSPTHNNTIHKKKQQQKIHGFYVKT